MANSKKLFVVLASDNPTALALRLGDQYADAHLSVAAGQWLVVTDSTVTTVEVCRKLGVLAGEEPYTSSAIVVSAGNYFGSAPGSTWEWVTAKMGGNDAVAS